MPRFQLKSKKKKSGLESGRGSVVASEVIARYSEAIFH